MLCSIQTDRPPPEYIQLVAGSSISASKTLCHSRSCTSATINHDSIPEADIAINWEGGRHHAMREKADGFCYVQDVALAIDELKRNGSVRTKSSEKPNSDGEQPAMEPSHSPTYVPQTRNRRPRILYLDLDIHFGDGVASSCRHPYRYSVPIEPQQIKQPKPSVLTVSLHHHARGFFPATPDGDLTPADTPSPFNLSIPLKSCVSSTTYKRLFESCIEPLKAAFDPDYVVLLLGMDALNGDDLVDGAGNWELGGEGGVAWTCEQIRSWGLRTLVLGGGGYNVLNTAKGWACATNVFVGYYLLNESQDASQTLTLDLIVVTQLGRSYDPEELVPEHQFWEDYGPDLTMNVPRSGVRDQNTEEHLGAIEQNCNVWVQRIKEIIG